LEETLIFSPTRKKLKLWRLTKIQVSFEDGTYLPWLTYIDEKGENFGQNIWDKRVVLLGIFWGTHWELGELFVNALRTEKNQIFPLSPYPPKNRKGKKIGPFSL
jgi:hypothetical protein